MSNEPIDQDIDDMSEEASDEIQKIVEGLVTLAKERRTQIAEKSDRIIADLESKKVKFGTRGKFAPSAPDNVPQLLFIAFRDDGLGEYTVTYTIGEYYRDKVAFDPTISEAFDAGFLTAIKMIEIGIISIAEDNEED